MEHALRILLVDQDEQSYVLIRNLLSGMDAQPFQIDWSQDYASGWQNIQKNQHDVYLIDHYLEEASGIELLQSALSIGIKSPIILLTSEGEAEVDHQAMQRGAADYLVKRQLSAATFERSIRYAIKHAQAISLAHNEEQRYRSLFEQSINAIYTTNADLRLTGANTAMLRLLGRSATAIKQQRLPQLFAKEEDHRRLQKELSQYRRVRDFEATLQRSDGRTIACSMSIAALTDVNNQVIGYQGVVEDISEKKRVQQELIRLEKLMMTGNIARSLAHEVRNPLTNIGLALEQFYGELNPENDLEVYYSIIKRNVSRIDELITAMLNSSKPSQLTLTQQPLEQVIEHALQLANDRIKLQEITLHRRYAQGLPTIPLDEQKVCLALLNIINNAIEVLPPRQGEISIKTGEDARYQYVQVIDNGPGINDQHLAHLFDAFYTEKPGGIGLGLTASQNIVNSHGGKISASSTFGKGATFTLAFKKAATAVS